MDALLLRCVMLSRWEAIALDTLKRSFFGRPEDFVTTCYFLVLAVLLLATCLTRKEMR